MFGEPTGSSVWLNSGCNIHIWASSANAAGATSASLQESAGLAGCWGASAPPGIRTPIASAKPQQMSYQGRGIGCPQLSRKKFLQTKHSTRTWDIRIHCLTLPTHGSNSVLDLSSSCGDAEVCSPEKSGWLPRLSGELDLHFSFKHVPKCLWDTASLCHSSPSV